jgi:alpha(1,3/1,4) fucosyltransferase
MTSSLAEMDKPATAVGHKIPIRLNVARFWPGAAEDLIDTLLPDLKPYYDVTISDAPQIVLYGPYTGDMPPGRYVKVFIGCENVRPLMDECDWAFGVAHDEYIGHPRYMRFARWGEDAHFVQKEERDWERALHEKTRFCAFLYTTRVHYREAFLSALSRYKKVDSPGPAMNNMRIEPTPGHGGNWQSKRAFLRNYKFVIAFENSPCPGYNTEKLTHAIEADCLPIYWGDTEIERSFNTARFINAHDYLPKPRRVFPRLPYHQNSLRTAASLTLPERIARKANGILYGTEQRLWALAGFDALIERIIEIDRDDDLYLRHLRKPFLIDNKIPDRTRWIARWHEIFAQAAAMASA